LSSREKLSENVSVGFKLFIIKLIKLITCLRLDVDEIVEIVVSDAKWRTLSWGLTFYTEV
jgi:hypothetical protein